MRHSFVTLMTVVSLALLGGCGGDQEQSKPSSAPTQSTASEQAAGPKVEVSADKTHAVQPGDEITLTIQVSGFTLDPAKMGKANEDGVGQYRVYLDDASGSDFLAQGADSTIKVVVPETITDGSHDLRVVLHNNDGTPLEPAAEGSVLLIVYRL